MLVLTAGPNADHAPPYELDDGRMVAPMDVPGRFEAIRAGLAQLPKVRFEPVEPLDPTVLVSLHDAGYVAFLRETCLELAANNSMHLFPSIFPYIDRVSVPNRKARFGQYCFDTYTPLLPGTFDAALRTASAALHAADRIADGTERIVYALGRPPGHHAERARCGGYSYLNGTALAADRLARLGRVAVLDVDIHHGNGTQHLFFNRADVLTVSIHGDPTDLFPYFSGFAEETGTGPGLGFNRNFPLPLGTTDRDYQPALESALEFIEGFGPEFLVVALGFDGHERDPIGRFGLTIEYFERLARTIGQLDRPMVIVQEGGYGLPELGGCAAAFGRGLLPSSLSAFEVGVAGQ